MALFIFKTRKLFFYFFGIIFFGGLCYSMYLLSLYNNEAQRRFNDVNSLKDLYLESSIKTEVIRKPSISEKQEEQSEDLGEYTSRPNYNVHLFYYAWYGNPEKDGIYLHWNHPFLPHWDKVVDRRYPKGRHKPPADIASAFFPMLGPYSSKDELVIENHMRQIVKSGAGVLALSWYPPGQADNEGHPADTYVPLILNQATKHNLKVCFHIEPYKNRNVHNVKENIAYIYKTYGSHPAFYRRMKNGRMLPLYYIYDSYQIPESEWSSIFTKSGPQSLRNTDIDGMFIGLLVDTKSKHQIKQSGFDGFYTYFASDGFTYGSSVKSWPDLSNFAEKNNLLFIPSVGPGYNDENIRPWNSQNSKDRQNGLYYQYEFNAAIKSRPDIISITSFNEWHEGTQIEKSVKRKSYKDYGINGPEFYLDLTKNWIKKFSMSYKKHFNVKLIS